MSETWVFNTKNSDAMIDFAAKGISEGWLISVYRVSDEDRLRTDERAGRYPEFFDQDA